MDKLDFYLAKISQSHSDIVTVEENEYMKKALKIIKQQLKSKT